MDVRQFFHQRHEQIVSTWFDTVYRDLSIRYHNEPAEDLKHRMNAAALAFRRVIVSDDWTDLKAFITMIARQRFKEGYKVSEVQKAFEFYRETLIPLVFSEIDPGERKPLLMKLHTCMVYAITQFSEYFQSIHDRFMRDHTKILEKEIEIRTHELSESRKKYMTLVENINEGFLVLIEGRIVFANRSFAEMHGYDHEAVLQTDYLNFVADDHKEKIRQAYELCLKPGVAPARIEYRRLCKNGEQLPTEIMANQNVFEGRMANIGICRDISERIELQKKNREMEKLKALSLQAASIAHDVRNPLSTVRMNLQLFLLMELPPERLRLVEASLTEVNQIEKSLQEMMNIRFPLRLSYRSVNIRTLLDLCLKSMHRRITQNQVSVLLRISRRIETINADPHRLEQALLNLLFNAVEAQPSGGKLTIIVRRLKQHSKEWVEILVADQGPGLPKEMLPYLFDPMFSQKAMGTGLGLHNVKKIIEAHGGSVRAAINRRSGMNFYLCLPVEEDKDHASAHH